MPLLRGQMASHHGPVFKARVYGQEYPQWAIMDLVPTAAAVSGNWFLFFNV